MLSRAHIKARRGAMMLDRQVPGWASRVDPDRLEIASCRNCVLGQLFGDYVDGLLALERPTWGMIRWAALHGFVPGCGQSMERAWKRQIALRQPKQVIHAREEDLAAAGD